MVSPRALLRRWVVLTIAASVANAAISEVAQPLTQSSLYVFVYVLTLLVTGVADWIVLRRYVPSAGRWIWATVFGGCAGMIVGTVPFLATLAAAMMAGWYQADAPPPRSLIIAAGALLVVCWQAVIGYAQARVLRRAARHASWWMGFTIVAMLLSLGLWLATGAVEQPGGWVQAVLAGAEFGAIYGLITGVGLVILLRDPPPPEPAPRPAAEQPPYVSTLPRSPEAEEWARPVRRVLLVVFWLCIGLVALAVVARVVAGG